VATAIVGMKSLLHTLTDIVELKWNFKDHRRHLFHLTISLTGFSLFFLEFGRMMNWLID
jgi:hypothetical protein